MDIAITSPAIAMTKEEYMATTKVEADSNVTETSEPVDTVTISEEAVSPLQAMVQSGQELSNVIKELVAAGASSTKINNTTQTATIEADKTFSIDVQQAYKSYVEGEISGSEFADRMYEAATKKLDSITSALKDVLASTRHIEEEKETANETDAVDSAKAIAMKSEDAAVDLAIKAEEEEGGNEKAEIGISEGEGILDSGSGSLDTDNAYSQLADFFNGIDKMIDGFINNAEGKGSDDEDKGDSLLNYAAKLNDMSSDINKVVGRQGNENVGHKLGMAQVNNETIGKLFDNGHGSGAINSIGDAGEGSGNFNAVSFMSSMSNGINDALESYKEVQRAENEAKEESIEEDVSAAA